MKAMTPPKNGRRWRPPGHDSVLPRLPPAAAFRTWLAWNDIVGGNAEEETAWCG